jgi:hypothetical protein
VLLGFILVIFGPLGNFNTTQSSVDTFNRMAAAMVLTIAPQGLGLVIDLIAAALSGYVVMTSLDRDVRAALFGGLVVYFFTSFLGNFLFGPV